MMWWSKDWNDIPVRAERPEPGAPWGKLKGAIIEVMKRKDRGLPLPSRYTDSPWIHATRRNPDLEASDEDKVGKWMIFVPHQQVDLKWVLIDQAHTAGVLGIHAKTSSSRIQAASGEHVICVYTKDWQDEEDVMRVRTKLRRLGFNRTLHYKRDVDTRAGKYSGSGEKVSVYSD